MFANFRKDREFFRMFLTIALPITVQNLIIFSVQVADTIMVGRLGEVPLSAVQQANQLSFLMILTVFGLVSGANVMVAQYWGKGDVENIHKVMTVTYRLVAVFVSMFAVLAIGFPVQVMSILGVEEIVDLGVSYLRVIGIAYLFTGFTASTLALLRAVATVKIALAVATSTLILNISGNWILIFGNLGAPALGVRGAAIATVIARAVELIIVLVYMSRFERKLRYTLRALFARGLNFLREYVESAAPVFINEVLWGMGAVVLSIIIGQMGTEFIAAKGVANVLGNLVSVAVFGAAASSAVIIGNTVGSGRYDLARERSSKLIIISLILGLFAMCMVLLLRIPTLALFGNLSDTAQAYAGQLILVNSVVMFVQAFTFVALVGVLRGGGDGKFAAMADIATMWGVALPLGFLAGHVWGLPVPVVFAFLKIDELLKVIVCLPRLLGGKWVRDVTLS